MPRYAMARRVDALGRVVLPADLRKLLDIHEGDVLGIQVDDAHIVLAKVTDSCIFCGESDELAEYRDKVVCRPCVDMLKMV